MYRLSPSLLLIIIQILVPISCQSHYSIVAPGTIRSNRNYSVCVSLHDAPTAATIRLSIRSLTNSTNLSQDITLQPYETKLVNFMPPRINNQLQYELKAEGLKGLVINESKKLHANEYGGPEIYVESDKGLYKPEDIVQFRAIILNEHVKVAKIAEPIRIQILDPQNNRIKQFKDIQLHRGVFVGKFQLSKQPILGKWTILVHIGGEYNMNKEYKFKVEKYVLPKFSVHIEHDRNLPEKDRIVRATIYGKYTYGKYVQGTVEVLLVDFMRYFKYAIKQTATIDDGNVKVDVAMDIGDMGYSPYIFIIATLKEKYSNVTATAESEIQIQYSRYKMTVPESGIELRDNKPYRMQLQVQQWNGTAVTDRTTPAVMHLKGKEYKSYLDSNGIAQFEFDYEPTRTFGFSYKDSQKTVDNMFVEQSSYDIDSTNCHLKMRPRGSVDLSTPLEFDVTSNDSIPYLMYTVTGHGNIVRDGFVRLTPNAKSYTIRIKATIAMVPQSYLFVYYILNGQLRYCELTIRLPRNFENQISIAAPTSVKPGQEITMNIKGQPNSRVSILAVDKSVLLMNSDNVLQKKDIMQDLLYHISYIKDNPFQRSYEYTPGLYAGLIIMTTAKYQIHTVDIPAEAWPLHGSKVIRSLFPETWIFQDIDIDKPNTALTLKVPDTITTWIVRAFSVNDDTGFGMMDETLDIQAFQPFFISVDLPYSVKRGEIVTIPVTIFNYLQQSHQTEVTMDNSNQDFQFMDDRNKPLAKDQDTRKVDVPANNGKSVAFTIAPKRVGKMEIRIVAKNSITSDGVVHKLKVEPEGIAHNHNRDELVTLVNGQTKKSTFEADIPAIIVPESEYLVLSISGDIMVSVLEHLDDLVQKPSGCGEQNMINLAPNILILDYLKAMDMYNNQTELVDKAKNFIEMGYQQELTYRHPNGAYSVFGPNSTDSKSTVSTWLTAYVTRFFMKGMKYSAIEPRIIEDGLQYLTGQQLDNGSFPNRGFIFDPAHQNQFGFTAFVLLTFLEDAKYAQKYNSVVQNGMTFLTNNINNVQDVYSLAIMANVFQMAGKTQANEILTKLKSMSNQGDGLKWWTSNKKHEKGANDVEITAYILMALLETSDDNLHIFNWLLKQRNSHGGFGSTHDTVVGLQALIKYAEKSIQTKDTQIKVHYVAKSDKGKSVKEQILGIDSTNELILQKQELPHTTRSVEVEVMGNGRAFLQFSYQYYVSEQPKQERGGSSSPASSMPSTAARTPPTSSDIQHQYFIIKPTAKKPSSSAMSLDICYTYQPVTVEEDLTNMVILQVQFPSGYTSNSANIETLRDEEHISRIDSQNPATMAIYFEKLEAHDEQCLTIMADKGHDVASLKPSSIEMYDFYNPKRRSTTMYEL